MMFQQNLISMEQCAEKLSPEYRGLRIRQAGKVIGKTYLSPEQVMQWGF